MLSLFDISSPKDPVKQTPHQREGRREQQAGSNKHTVFTISFKYRAQLLATPRNTRYNQNRNATSPIKTWGWNSLKWDSPSSVHKHIATAPSTFSQMKALCCQDKEDLQENTPTWRTFLHPLLKSPGHLSSVFISIWAFRPQTNGFPKNKADKSSELVHYFQNLGLGKCYVHLCWPKLCRVFPWRSLVSASHCEGLCSCRDRPSHLQQKHI